MDERGKRRTGGEREKNLISGAKNKVKCCTGENGKEVRRGGEGRARNKWHLDIGRRDGGMKNEEPQRHTKAYMESTIVISQDRMCAKPGFLLGKACRRQRYGMDTVVRRGRNRRGHEEER